MPDKTPSVNMEGPPGWNDPINPPTEAEWAQWRRDLDAVVKAADVLAVTRASIELADGAMRKLAEADAEPYP